ncbi:MAG: DUF302 domain-containing protein [Rhodothermales bacterium]|nr:DUF302 domain-containing protein [Rhodothermales bacterium]
MKLLISAWMLLLVLPVQAQRVDVYSYLRTDLSQPVAEVSAQIQEMASSAGLEVQASLEAGVPDGCSFAAEVLVLHDPDYAASLMAMNPRTGAFATTDRILVFEDERGTHVSMVDPVAVVRTVMLDLPSATELARTHRSRVEAALAALPGDPASKGYGPSRDRGLIGKTMGVMAGGPFDEKVQEHGRVNRTRAEVATALQSALTGTGTWQLSAKYRLDYPNQGITVLGVTGASMEARSFEIVKEGSDGDRGSLQCPGTAHAAAYPIELVIREDGDEVAIEFIDAMYRMKMFFEDAGKWAFMKNMGMPGSIADDLKDALSRAGAGS